MISDMNHMIAHWTLHTQLACHITSHITGNVHNKSSHINHLKADDESDQSDRMRGEEGMRKADRIL